MDQSLINLAKKAEANSALLAAQIARFEQQEGLRWDEVATRLRISQIQLAKLALCRTPRQTNFKQDVSSIANYAGVNESIVKQILQQEKVGQPAASVDDKINMVRKGFWGTFKGRSWAVAVAALFLFIIGAVAFAQPKRTEATLVVSQGQATVAKARGSILASAPKQLVVSTGDIVAVTEGDDISVNAGSAAQLRLFDGSTIDLAENTSVNVSELFTTEETYRVGIKMLSGKTVSRVIRLIGAGDAFKVSTPSSTASVRGTVFTVAVVDAETTYIACDEGVVQVETESADAPVPAGTAVMAVSGKSLDVKPKAEIDPPGPPDSVPGSPPAGGEDPPGPPDAVPGNPPADPPGNGNPPAGEGDPPGPPDEVPGSPPDGAKDEPGPPDGVPADPPGQNKNKSRNKPQKNGPPNSVPGNPPEEVPGEGNPPDGEVKEKPPKAGPPDQVPGNTPEDPGNGNPPTGGGTPPGQGGEPPGQTKDDTSTSNNSGGNGKDK